MLFTLTMIAQGKALNTGIMHVKNAILGKKYELSVAYINAHMARQLNRIYRKKDYSADVLAFPLSRHSGEILIRVPVTNQNAQSLVIHALLHLAGYKHGVIMKAKEYYYDKKYFSRNRRRNPRNPRGGSRACKR